MAIRGGNAPLNVETVTAAGSEQADAAAIPSMSSPALVLAAGDDSVGILLPKASKGKVFYVKNTGGGGLKVWPYSGDAINALGADTAITMATVTAAVFAASSTSQWYTIPLLPS